MGEFPHCIHFYEVPPVDSIRFRDRKLPVQGVHFQITGKKETVLYIHYGFSDGNIRDEVVIILCAGKLVEYDEFNRFLQKIGKCITAPGWSMKGAFMRDAIPTSRWDGDMDGLDRCLMDQHEIIKFKVAYCTLMGPSCD